MNNNPDTLHTPSFNNPDTLHTPSFHPNNNPNNPPPMSKSSEDPDAFPPMLDKRKTLALPDTLPGLTMNLTPVLSDVQFDEYLAKFSRYFPGLPITKCAIERRMRIRNTYEASLRKANHRVRVIQIKLNEANACKALDEELFQFYQRVSERDAITQVYRKKRRNQYTGQAESTKRRRRQKEREEMKGFIASSDGSSDDDDYQQYKRRRRERRRLKKVQRYLDDAPSVPYDAMDTQRSVTPSPTHLLRQGMTNMGM